MCSTQDITGGPTGPTSEEKGLSAQDSDLSGTLNAHYEKAFGDQMDSLNMLKSTISRIQSGTTGPGFSADELAARTGQIVNQAGANARNVQQLEANQGAGQTFGGSSDSSGLARSSAIRRQLTGEAASAGENQKAGALENLTAENYATGRMNADKTAAGLESLSGAYGGAANSSLSGRLTAGQNAFGEAEQLHQEKDAAGGGFGKMLAFGAGLAGDFLTGGLSAGAGGFMKGGLGALAGTGFGTGG
jgi:hypothetical protein